MSRFLNKPTQFFSSPSHHVLFLLFLGIFFLLLIIKFLILPFPLPFLLIRKAHFKEDYIKWIHENQKLVDLDILFGFLIVIRRDSF